MKLNTHLVRPGATCTDGAKCGPLGQAISAGWVIDFESSGAPAAYGRGHAVGSFEERTLSLFNFCPFCGVHFHQLDGYVRVDGVGTGVPATKINVPARGPIL